MAVFHGQLLSQTADNNKQQKNNELLAQQLNRPKRKKKWL